MARKQGSWRQGARVKKPESTRIRDTSNKGKRWEMRGKGY
jgi:hypothetical protein